MFKKIFTILAVAGLVGFQLTGCGKQTNGNVADAASQNSEESISSTANESIGLSNINSSSLGVSDYGLESPASSCPAVTKIGPLGVDPVTWTITLNFDGGCIPAFVSRVVSGSITMTVSKFTNTTSGAVTEVTVNADKNIAITRFDGASLYVSGTTDILRTGSLAGQTITRTVDVAETRTALGPAGRERLHQNITLNFTAQDTLSSSTPPVTVTQRVLNGSGTIDHLLLKVLASVTVTNLTYQQGYCHPQSGSIAEVLTSDVDGSAIGTYTLVFLGGDSATLNGNPITLNPCD